MLFSISTRLLVDEYTNIVLTNYFSLSQLSSKRSSSFRRAIANGRRTLQREILLDETGLGVYKRFVRYVAYEILPCETDRRWYFHQNRLCPPPVFMAIITIIQVHLPLFPWKRIDLTYKRRLPLMFLFDGPEMIWCVFVF